MLHNDCEEMYATHFCSWVLCQWRNISYEYSILCASFIKRNSILMCSTNSYQIQLIALALMWVACWLVKSDEEKRQNCIGVRKNARGEGKLFPSQCFSYLTSRTATLCHTIWLLIKEHLCENTEIISGKSWFFRLDHRLPTRWLWAL